MTHSLPAWLLWALASAVFAAASGITAKLGVADLPATQATLIRTAIVVLLAALVAATGGTWRALDTLSGRTWLFLVLSALATGGSWIAYFHALSLGDAARVAPLDKLSVVLVAVLGTTLLGEHLSPTNWAGVALIALGAVLVALP